MNRIPDATLAPRPAGACSVSTSLRSLSLGPARFGLPQTRSIGAVQILGTALAFTDQPERGFEPRQPLLAHVFGQIPASCFGLRRRLPPAVGLENVLYTVTGLVQGSFRTRKSAVYVHLGAQNLAQNLWITLFREVAPQVLTVKVWFTSHKIHQETVKFA